MTASRDTVLAAVRRALAPGHGPVPIPRHYRRAGQPAGVDLAGLFADRVADYQARVHVTHAAALPALLTELLGPSRVGVPPALPAAWTSGLPGAVPDRRLSLADLDALDAALTGCALAIAETGTFVLDSSPVCGRRALTLIPDRHVAVVHIHQIVPAVPDAVAALNPTRPLTFISGPSATSDIELNRVEGVHGPRTLDVVIVHDTPPPVRDPR